MVTVVVDDFTDDGGRNQPVHLRQVDVGTGVSGKDEYAAFGREAGRDDRVGRCLWVWRSGNGGLNSQARSAAEMQVSNAVCGFDGDSKVGAVLRADFLGHHRQPKVFDHFAVHRQADQATRVFHPEVDGFERETNCAAISRSPSFSRSSASVMMTILHTLMSARISGMGKYGTWCVFPSVRAGGRCVRYRAVGGHFCRLFDLQAFYTPKDLFLKRAESSPVLRATASAKRVCNPP